MVGRALVLAMLALPPAATAAKRPTCAPGRFVIAGAAIVAGGAPNRQAILLSATELSVGGCIATPAKMKATRRGTVVKARWRNVASCYPRAKLVATIDGETCTTMTGAFRVGATKLGSPRRFKATRAQAVTTCTQGLTTFESIEQRVFGAHGCTVNTCHGSAREGDLDLLSDVAYDELVDTRAANTVARAAGAVRVAPGDSAASFLVRKLRGTLAAGEGARMPLVGTPLADDELALVEAWIAGGAPRTGRIDGAPCLPPPTYVPVTAPPPPPGGYQLVLDGPTLEPGHEEEGCLWVPTPNAADFVVGTWEFALEPGTHHFAIFPWDKPGQPAAGVWGAGDVGCTSGAMFGASLSGAPQAPYFVDTLPAGLGRVLPAGGWLGLNAHYANDFDEPIHIKVWINIVPYAGTPAHLVRTVTDFDDMFSIDVPPGTQKLQTGRFVNGGTTALSIVQLAGHMHKRGLRFTARGADGAVLVENLDWAHPSWRPFDPPLVLAPGGHIDYECLHDNGVTREVRRDTLGNPTNVKFGITTDDEMCTLTVVGYDD